MHDPSFMALDDAGKAIHMSRFCFAGETTRSGELIQKKKNKKKTKLRNDAVANDVFFLFFVLFLLATRTWTFDMHLLQNTKNDEMRR